MENKLNNYYDKIINLRKDEIIKKGKRLKKERKRINSILKKAIPLNFLEIFAVLVFGLLAIKPLAVVFTILSAIDLIYNVYNLYRDYKIENKIINNQHRLAIINCQINEIKELKYRMNQEYKTVFDSYKISNEVSEAIRNINNQIDNGKVYEKTRRTY